VRVADHEAVLRFEREVAVLRDVDHPGIVAVLGQGECPDGRPYLVIERAERGTLQDALAAGRHGAAEAAALGAMLAGALDHAHRRGIVHRDVKPANVLLGPDGRAMLADFGIARLAGAAGLTATGWAMGTPAYLAPEQVRGEFVGPPADVYALGLVVLEAATGQRAFPGDGLNAAFLRLERPVQVPTSVPVPLAAAIVAMTAQEPGERPTAGEVAARLEAAADAGSTAAVPVATTATAALPVVVEPDPRPDAEPRTDSGGRLRRWLPVAWLLAGLLAVALLYALLSGGDDRRGLVPTDAKSTTTTIATTTTPATADDQGEDGDDEDEDEDGGGRGNGQGNGNGGGNGSGRGDGDD
jgi:eukaryotic-like serine/threonine-protein kinase